jgi:hypothetical protein
MDLLHTPGPWEVSGDGIWGSSPFNARVKLATVTVFSPMNRIDWLANAKLIAASPKMLETLLQIDREMNAGHGSSFGETREAVRRAIVWATTQSPK